jgi:ketosteroid isomerase-like protein
MNAVRAEIDKLRSEFEAAVATGRIEAILPLLAEGAVMVQPGAPDWKAMQAAATGAPFPPGARIAIRPMEVVVLNDDWAYEFGTSTTTYTPPETQDVTQLRDTYLIIFRKTAEGWRAFREVASSSPPPGGWPVS